MESKKLLNEIEYTKSLMGVILEGQRSELALDYPRIESKLKDIEKKSGYKYKITDENVEFEFKNEEGPSVDNGAEDPSARKQAELMTTKMVELFPELNGMRKIVSSYRSYDEQVQGFLKHLDRDGGPLGRQKWVALPGFSQHHTGKAFDIFSTEPSWWDSRPKIKQWVADNCNKYGFKLSYPTSRGLGYRGAEPWHLFYIGGSTVRQDNAANEMSNLKSLLTSLGYTYKKTMDERGPLDSNFISCLKSVAKSMKTTFPEYSFRFGAGMDFWHQSRKTSRHNTGRAVDIVFTNPSRPSTQDLDNLCSVLCAARTKINGFTFIDEYRCPSRGATGPHFHLSWWPTPSDESNCTPKFCSNPKINSVSASVMVPDSEEVDKDIKNIDKDVETTDIKTTTEKQPDKLEKILTFFGLKKLAQMDLDKDGVQFSKEVSNLFGGDDDEIEIKDKKGEEKDSDSITLFGYKLGDIVDAAKKLFEHQLREDINKMKKPLK